ncbi:MAG: hypothetical protein LBE08_12665, partial [Bifidobacteriaceae bacterium]|nr:hypothetical protein [Bifidobacteriaceae bacterium]
MTTRKLVVFTDQTDLDQAPAKAHLAEHGLDAVSLELRPGVAVPDRFRDAIGLVVGYARIDAAVFDQMPGLLAVATCSTGADMVDVATASSRGVEVVPLTDVSTKEVAAHTVALALGSVRCLAEGAAVVRAGGWTADLKVVPPDLGALTLGLVGFGRIGRQVAAWLGPMFGRVLACDPLAAGAAGGAAGGPELVGLSELIEQADLISLH